MFSRIVMWFVSATGGRAERESERVSRVEWRKATQREVCSISWCSMPSHRDGYQHPVGGFPLYALALITNFLDVSSTFLAFPLNDMGH